MENQTNTQAQQRRAAAATAQSDEISQTLDNLTEIVRLAAFAAEARRTLVGIDNTLHYRPEMKQIIRDSVLNAAQWSEMEDNTGEVLFYVARQLEKVNGDFTENLYDLAHPSRGLTEAEKIGGED
jgi:hypothetical protein